MKKLILPIHYSREALEPTLLYVWVKSLNIWNRNKEVRF